jgi:hypothetical protein
VSGSIDIEELDRRRRVRELGLAIQWNLEQIRALYKTDTVVITLIVRAPAHPDGRRDTILTDDPDPVAAVQAFRKAITDVDGHKHEYYRLDPEIPP